MMSTSAARQLCGVPQEIVGGEGAAVPALIAMVLTLVVHHRRPVDRRAAVAVH